MSWDDYINLSLGTVVVLDSTPKNKSKRKEFIGFKTKHLIISSAKKVSSNNNATSKRSKRQRSPKDSGEAKRSFNRKERCYKRGHNKNSNNKPF